MNWVGVTGSWRKTSPGLHYDLRHEIQLRLEEGKGIVTGGALGVDYAATSVALNYAPDGSRLKVILPTTLEIYAAHYRRRAQEGVITEQQAERLVQQLETVQRLGALVVNPEETEVNERTYYLRNTEVVNASDEMIAFQVNDSKGTQDAIDKARERGIPVAVFKYFID